MRISEDKVAQVPAAGLDLWALLPHGEERRKQRDEALALALAPVAPNAHLPGIGGVVCNLPRPGINHHADWDVSLLQFLPQEIHLCFLLGDSPLNSQRRIANFIGVFVGNLPVSPRRALQVKLVAAMPQFEVIPAKPDKVAFKKLEDVIGNQQVIADTEPQLRVPVRLRVFLVRYFYGARSVFVVEESGLILDIGKIDEDDHFVNVNSLVEDHPCGIEIVGWGIALHASVEKFILRKISGNAADEAVAPGGHALRSRIAEYEDPGPKIGARDFSDLLVSKAETVGIKLVRIPEPGTDAGTVGLEGEMTHGITREAEPMGIAGHGAAQDRRAVKPGEGEKQDRA